MNVGRSCRKRQRKNERPGRKRVKKRKGPAQESRGGHLLMFCFQARSMKMSEDGEKGKKRMQE